MESNHKALVISRRQGVKDHGIQS